MSYGQPTYDQPNNYYPPAQGSAAPMDGKGNKGYPQNAYPGTTNKPDAYHQHQDVEAANPRVPQRREPFKFAGATFDSEWEKQIRVGFIRKVYGILTVQLIVMFGGCYMFTAVDSIREFVQDNVGTLWAAYILMIVLMCVLVCSKDARRRVPMNYILLGGFTLCATYFAGVISSFYDTNVVVLAMGITIGCVIGLTLFACQTKIDFTLMGGVLFSFLWILILFGFLNIFWRGPFMSTVYAGFGALLFCAYIVYDTQLIVGGKHKAFQLTEDEYVFAALNLFIDVFQLFLLILQLLGGGGRRR